MPVVSMKDMLIVGKNRKYAVGQFNIINLEFTQAILQAANEEKSPVILGVSEGAANYMGGFKFTVQMVKELMKEYKVTVPVAIHLDQGSSFDICIQAIHAGFTSVMVDASQYQLEENIKLSKSVVEVAHAVGASVEAKLGRIGDQEDSLNRDVDATWAIPLECEQLLRETGVDCLALSFGSYNGPYNFRFHRMKEIMDLTGVPLALNVAGFPIKDIQKAIFFGAAKIDVDTENQVSATEVVRSFLIEKPNEYDPRIFLGPAREAIKNTVKGKMQEFGSSGRAQLKYEVLYR
jgi:fructose-bisphosphate aldolase, class II